MTRIKVTVRLDPASLDQAKAQALDMTAQKVIRGFDRVVGPHVLSVAKKRSPVGKRETKNPQRSSFRKLRLADRDEGRFTTEEVSRLRDLRTLAAQKGGLRNVADELRSSDVKFFRGTGKNEGLQPDQIDIQRGTVKGAFIHKPGTLRDSHIYVPARRKGPNVVIAEVRAKAPYAAAQHEGFTHHSHGKPTGKFVKGNPWLYQALGSGGRDMVSPETYEG